MVGRPRRPWNSLSIGLTSEMPVGTGSFLSVITFENPHIHTKPCNQMRRPMKKVARNVHPHRTPYQERAKTRKIASSRSRTGYSTFTGSEAVSVRRVAREAGVSIGTIYAYFRDKQDIFVAARQMYRHELYENFLEVIEHELDAAASVEEALMAMIKKRLDQVMGRHLTFYREMLILVLRDEGRN